MRQLALALAFSAVLNSVFTRPPAASGLAGLGLHVEQKDLAETAAFVAMGLRRLAADLGLIRLIVYYGTPEAGEEHAGHRHDAKHGDYPEMARKARAALDLDPAFKYPVLLAAGALAFNLDRPDEALNLLAYALERDPRDIKYRSYVAAIAFHKKGDSDSVIKILEPALRDPDCPTMIKSMMAFIYKRKGYRRKAVKLYLEIYATSRDAGYRAIAEKMLKELAAAPPVSKEESGDQPASRRRTEPRPGR